MTASTGTPSTDPPSTGAVPPTDVPSSARRRTLLRRLVLAGVVVAALGLFVLAALLADTDNAEDEGLTEGVVEGQLPVEGTEVLSQTPVAIDLAPGWTGDLSVNGVQIPEEQLVRNEPLNLIEFRPGAGQAVTELGPGRNCARAVVWPSSEGPEGPSQRIVAWCFNVT